MSRINCFKCAYFKITWDQKFPKGCGFFGFKSAGMPSDEVYASAGAECAVFEDKSVRKEKNGEAENRVNG